jgi:Ca2+/Na+ antiporter
LLYFPLSFLVIIVIFRFMSQSVSDYIAEGLVFISDSLGLSEQMGAVTLIGVANGIADMLVAIVAASSG